MIKIQLYKSRVNGVFSYDFNYAERYFLYNKVKLKLGVGSNDHLDLYRSMRDKNLFYLLGYNPDLEYYSINEIRYIKETNELLQDDRFFKSYSIEEAIEEYLIAKNFKDMCKNNQAKELIRYCWDN